MPETATFLIAYLIGAIPCGVLLVKIGGGIDPRTIGSKNIGATNVWRSSKIKGIITFLGDTLKGTAVVMIAMRFDEYSSFELSQIAALGAVIGHVMPIYLGFRGGKGIATYFGVVLALEPVLIVFMSAIWLFILWVTNYVSLSSLVTVAALPFISFYLGRADLSLLMVVIGTIVVLRHHQNIARLLQQKEPKIGQKNE